MTEHYQFIASLLERVRVRWRRLVAYRATMRTALLVTAVLAVFDLLARFITRAPLALATLGVLTLILAIAAIVRGLLPLRDEPSDAQIARFIEERKTELDERL